MLHLIQNKTARQSVLSTMPGLPTKSIYGRIDPMSYPENTPETLLSQGLKYCHRCEIVKPVSEFYKNKSKKDGYNWNCKECHKKWVSDNKERVQAIKRKHYENNIDEIKSRSKKRYETQKDEIKKYRLDNADKKRAYMKKYCATEQHKKNRSENRKNRRRTDSKYRLNALMRNSMAYSLKNNPLGKNGKSWKELVPYSVDELMLNLKHKIPKGYTWDDFLNGTLQIDHKIPIAKLNFTKPTDPDFEICWSLKNLQLLPAEENLRKSDKLEKPLQMSLAF